MRRNIVQYKYEDIYNDYINGSDTVKTIGVRYGVSHTTVYAIIKKYKTGNINNDITRKKPKKNYDVQIITDPSIISDQDKLNWERNLTKRPKKIDVQKVYKTEKHSKHKKMTIEQEVENMLDVFDNYNN